VFEEPRELLKAAGVELLEYERNRKQALCCGGGGGRLWMETEPENRFSTHKMRQADQAGAEVVATCCPYCISMLTDSAKGEGLEDKVAVKDVAEILAECL
jgi:Fe-S oxidoreductase